VPENKAPDEKTNEERSPSNTLIHCLEDFGHDEPQKVIIIWTTVGGDICWSESGPSHFAQNIGMLECVKAQTMKNFLE
jgi:hypothetical protein